MVWNKPWRLTEGFLIGVGLIVVGLVLQLTVGPVNWDVFAWPVNICTLAVMILIIVGMHLLRRRVYAFTFMGTWTAAVPTLAFGALLTVIMGLTRQQDGGTWLNDMLTFWPFVLIYTYMVLILGLVTMKRLAHFPPKGGLWRTVSFLLNHLGLFLALTAGTLGNADMQQLQMWTTNNPEMANMLSGSDTYNRYERFAINNRGERIELPLAIELKRFINETYDDGTPRRYASDVVIYSKTSMHRYAATIDVNHPVTIDGWKIYQKDFRLTEADDDCQVSILELVRDPWLPWVYAGIIMMLAGALTLLTSRRGLTSRHQDNKIIR